jgi:pimeloyl-ACP methyl ester carboxylesterase
MIKHSIRVMGAEAAYWERNPQWDQTIVMLHGFRGNHAGLTDLAQHFAGWRIILPDLPGYGESEPLEGEHSPANYAVWLDEFVTVVGLANWISWSHSYSGSIALIQAAQGRQRPRAVVCVSPALPRPGLSNAVTTMYYQTGRLLPEAWRQRWISSRSFDHATGRWLFKSVPTNRRREIQRKAERHLPKLNAEVVTEQYLSALQTDLRRYAARVTMPDYCGRTRYYCAAATIGATGAGVARRNLGDY